MNHWMIMSLLIFSQIGPLSTNRSYATLKRLKINVSALDPILFKLKIEGV